MDLYPDVIRPVLFRLSADTAHRLAVAALRWPSVWRRVGSGPDHDPRLAVEVGGLRLANPVGLAPGFDKDGEVLASLMHLGFGYLAPGAIMREVRAGNPRPRLGRIVGEQAVINCMGLPSKGQGHAVARLRALERRRVPIFACVQGVSPEAILETAVAIQPYVDALEIGLTCPNTGDTDPNRELSAAIGLMHEIARARQRPVFLKVPLHFRTEPRGLLPAFLDACAEAGFEGVIASAARRYRTDRLSIGYGQLSGRPVFRDTLALVREIAGYAEGKLAIIAAGGVSTGRDAYAMLRAGASAVEIYSALVYRGWTAPALINRELVAVLEAEGVESVQALGRRGAPAVAGGVR
jgi:dihydroorotate dehydrogenase